VGKRQVEVGGVRIRKIIRTEQVQQPVTLQREEVVVERVPAGQQRTPGERAFQGEEIFIPLRTEEPVVQKEARVKEEVRVRKESIPEQRTVGGTVRKEDIETERRGDVKRNP
jgi:uncharacterized protein (TIGR02271 family)